jgi:hypothetical protein
VIADLAAGPAAIDGLFASTPAALPFDRSLQIRAFVLVRDQGNLLIYSSPSLDADAPAIEALGGVSRQYLGHRHEAALASIWRPAALFVHERERAAVSKSLHIRGSFSRRHMLDDDFEVIPTPGHTAGASSFLWDTGEHRLLFTADTIYLRDGEWHAAVLGDSDRGRYLESLDLIRSLDFDVLVPWAASAGQPCCDHTTAPDTRRRIDALIDRVWRAGSG